MADNTEKIAYYDTVLDSGAESVSVDGQSTRYDLTLLQQRRNEAALEDDNPPANARRTIQSIPLDGSW